MNTSLTPSPKPKGWLLQMLALTFALGLLLLGLAVFGVATFLRLDSDERALRNGLLSAAAGGWERKIEINLGAFTVGLARAGLLLAPLEPQAQEALNCLRAGEVGIYQLEEPKGRMNRAAMLGAADRVMKRRGWERLVGVLEADDLVAVYLPRKVPESNELRICVVVMDKDQLIVASARADVEALQALIAKNNDVANMLKSQRVLRF